MLSVSTGANCQDDMTEFLLHLQDTSHNRPIDNTSVCAQTAVCSTVLHPVAGSTHIVA